MDMLSSIEVRIERWLRRVFLRRKGRGGVQPVLIAHEAVKAMEGMRQVSVDTIYVPNHFDVRLHPVDHGAIAPVQQTIRRDCIAHVVRTAKRRGLSFTGPVEIELTPDESVLRGELQVTAFFREKERPFVPEAAETARYVVQSPNVAAKPIGETASNDGARDDMGTRLYPKLISDLSDEGGSCLEVCGGPGQGKLTLIPGKSYIVGRADDSDLRLDDPRVSRHHARLLYENGSWWIEDLQTTNGTRKNGVALRRERLQDGDELTVGLTMLRFSERTERR